MIGDLLKYTLKIHVFIHLLFSDNRVNMAWPNENI